MSNRLVIYHDPCADGTGAAYAAYLAFGEEAEYLGASYGDEAPNVKDKDVYLLDFSYPRDVLEYMNKQANSMLVLDHHKTAKENLEGLPYAQFNMNKSGAILAWEYFHPNKRPPAILLYIQDRDIWKWELFGTEEIGFALDKYDKDFRTLGQFDVKELYKQGVSLVEENRKKVKDIASTYSLGILAGYKVPFVKTDNLISEVGNYLSRDFPFAVMYFQLDNGNWKYSLRSKPKTENPKGIDVTDITKILMKTNLVVDAGGHKHAGGFLTIKPLNFNEENDILELNK